jgi:branched-subunit amino acid aminotransferase/4-amino-4-deoxychorismate lyase
MAYCILNGELIPQSKAVVSVADRGFRYGDGLFETIAVHKSIPYQFAWHMSRLATGLRALKIPFDTAILNAYCRDLITRNKIEQGLLRIQITRGTGGTGYLPAKDTPPTYLIETMPAPAISEKPASLWLSSLRKIAPNALPVASKLCQGLNSTLTRLEASENNCFDSLLLNARSEIAETSSGNIFWQKAGTLYTPSLACGILEGSTRAAILRLWPGTIIEIEASLEHLLEADAVAICNVAWQALAVSELLPTAARWNSEPLAASLCELITADKERAA